jgi:hypothetical protein
MASKYGAVVTIIILLRKFNYLYGIGARIPLPQAQVPMSRYSQKLTESGNKSTICGDLSQSIVFEFIFKGNGVFKAKIPPDGGAVAPEWLETNRYPSGRGA